MATLKTLKKYKKMEYQETIKKLIKSDQVDLSLQLMKGLGYSEQDMVKTYSSVYNEALPDEEMNIEVSITNETIYISIDEQRSYNSTGPDNLYEICSDKDLWEEIKEEKAWEEEKAWVEFYDCKHDYQVQKDNGESVPDSIYIDGLGEMELDLE